MAKKRVRDLVEYQQLAVGEPGYIPPSSLFTVFDSDNFGSEPKKYSVESLFIQNHEEKKRITGLVSRSVSITFDTAFVSVPITETFNVFRYYDELGDGKYTKKQVGHYLSGSNWLTASGFAITIDLDESLTGVIIEYVFKEA